VDRARKSVPTNTGEFAARVAALKERIDALQVRLAASEKKQTVYLAQIAIQELEQQKNRLATYQVQARFALATMYDRAANTDVTHTEQGAAVPKGAEAPDNGSPDAKPADPSKPTPNAEPMPQASPAPESQPVPPAPAPVEPKP
jgi:hypothetical protein